MEKRGFSEARVAVAALDFGTDCWEQQEEGEKYEKKGTSQTGQIISLWCEVHYKETADGEFRQLTVAKLGDVF